MILLNRLKNIFQRKSLLQCHTLEDLSQWDDATLQRVIVQALDNNDTKVLRHFLQYYPEHPIFIQEWRQRKKSWDFQVGNHYDFFNSSKFFNMVKNLTKLPDFILEDWWNFHGHHEGEKYFYIGKILSHFPNQWDHNSWIDSIPDEFMKRLLIADYAQREEKGTILLVRLAQKGVPLKLKWCYATSITRQRRIYPFK